MKYFPLYGYLILFLLMGATGCRFDNTSPIGDSPTVQNTTESSQSGIEIPGEKLNLPLDEALSRVTKKTFGMKISPKDSPVSPEKFTGYHTGVDFEIFSNEADTDVVIRGICSGPLVLKKWATGYGGVAVQKCTIENEEVTIVYGHLKYESISTLINTEIKTGEKIGILGKGYTTETDGERKHLHLDIHKGSGINIAGYTSTSAGLASWIDPMKYLKSK